MISEQMFREALIAAGAKQVSHGALVAFNIWMTKFMTQEAHKAVTRMQADERVRIERRDIGE
jgi:histone H3/H4